MDASDPQLRVTEIFRSLQGETRTVGIATTFVRLTGCPLRCTYCDTAYAFTGGRSMRLGEVVTEVARHGTRHVTVTGGEPLAQKNCLSLLARLCDAGHEVSLETSGAMDVRSVDRRVSRVVDVKTPGSGEVDRNLPAALVDLGAHDQVKFVVCDRPDYEWAAAQLPALPRGPEVFFSPAHGQLAPGRLADWILADRLPVRLQVQLHKYLWGDARGR